MNKNKYIITHFSDKIKASHFYSRNFLIDNLCAINDSGDFGRRFCGIYPKEHEQQGDQGDPKHQGDYVIFFKFEYNHQRRHIYA